MAKSDHPEMRVIGSAGAVWGVGGVMLLLASAVYRLSPVAWAALQEPLDGVHWAFLIVFLSFMVAVEGYMGFQRGFSPRVVARAAYLRRHPRHLHALLAPLFCMGYFHATRRRQATSVLVTAAIIGLVLLVRQMPQPWRGIVDLGVVAGLVWGLVSMAVFVLVARSSREWTFPTDVPEDS